MSNGKKMESRATCSVGLKSPNGLILRLYRKVEVQETTPAGPKTFEQWFPDQEAGTVTLKGYKGAAFGIVQPFTIQGQYAITNNVPMDFMQAWWNQNKDTDLVKKGLIFIEGDENEASAHGRDQRAVWDGLHPLKMPNGRTEAKSKDPRVPKKILFGDKNSDNVSDDDVLSRPESPVRPTEEAVG